jgi:hypothetical protein
MALPNPAPIRLQQIQAEYGTSGLAASAVAGISGTGLVGNDLQPDRSMLDFLGRSNISYAWGGYPRQIPEGSVGIFNVITTGIPNGTVLYWTIENITTDIYDFPYYETGDNRYTYDNEGYLTMNNGGGQFNVPLNPSYEYDTTLIETFRIKVYSTGQYGIPAELVLTSDPISIIPTLFLYASPGAYTLIPPSSTIKYAKADVCGGGGGGAGHWRTADSADRRAGGGGGGAGAVQADFDMTTVSGNITVVVGSGGAAGPCLWESGYLYGNSPTIPRTNRNGGDNGTESYIYFNKVGGGGWFIVAGGGQGARGNNVDNSDQASGAGGNSSGGYINWNGFPGGVPSTQRDYYPRTPGGGCGGSQAGSGTFFSNSTLGGGGQSQGENFTSNSYFDLPYPGNHGVVYIRLSTVPSGYEGVGGDGVMAGLVYRGGPGA